MNRRIQIIALFFGATATILGAFGAHGLKKMVTIESVNSFEIGVRYQMYHALFLLFIGLSYLSVKQKKIILTLTVLGVVFFSGSIYGLATNSLHSFFDFKRIALITPVGGLCLISAWIYALICYVGEKSKE